MTHRSLRAGDAWRYVLLVVIEFLFTMRLNYIVAPIFGGLLIFSVLCSQSRAQSTNGTLHGTIYDQIGAVIAGAVITVEAQNYKRTVKSYDDGTFQAVLPAGAYKITVEYPGFITANGKVRIESEVFKEVKFVLKVKQIKQGKCPKGENCLWL